ncbi:MAG TPA: hypothetical protein DIU35_15325 [Candidatus Latescibacteria bacterium]|nr:hypothetical protein [Candidatus Latescibacterota bacterium]
MSYIGELGWELFTPTEYGQMMWDMLFYSGRSWSVFSLGGGAFNSLRMEKGYRTWGAVFHTDYNPWEAGSGWAVKLEKRDFVGRNTLVDLA